MINKNILAIEISTELYSVAIKYNNKIFTKYKFMNKKKHQNILLLINNIIKKKKINIKKINYIVINKGPGSLIGTRLSYIISKIFRLKYKKIKIVKTTSFKIIQKNYIHKNYNINNKHYLIAIYNSKNKILVYISTKKNIIKYNNIKNFKKKIEKFNKKFIIIVNNYQFKKKIKNIKNKKIYIYYPKAKYMLF